MSNIADDKKRYLREVRSMMICRNKLTKQYISELSNGIDDYIEAYHISDIREVINHFGSAEDISRSFLTDTDLSYLAKRVKIKRMVMSVLLVALILWGMVVGFAAIDTYRENRGYGIESTVISPSENFYENYTLGEIV